MGDYLSRLMAQTGIRVGTRGHDSPRFTAQSPQGSLDRAIPQPIGIENMTMVEAGQSSGNERIQSGDERIQRSSGNVNTTIPPTGPHGALPRTDTTTTVPARSSHQLNGHPPTQGIMKGHSPSHGKMNGTPPPENLTSLPYLESGNIDTADRSGTTPGGETGVPISHSHPDHTLREDDRPFSHNQIESPNDSQPSVRSPRRPDGIHGYLDVIGSQLEPFDSDQHTMNENPPIHHHVEMHPEIGNVPATRHHELTDRNIYTGTPLQREGSTHPSSPGPEIRDLRLSIGSIRVVVESPPGNEAAINIKRRSTKPPVRPVTDSMNTTETGRLNRHYIR